MYLCDYTENPDPRRKFISSNTLYIMLIFLSGIGNPTGNMDIKAFILSKFSPLKRKQIDEALKQNK